MDKIKIISDKKIQELYNKYHNNDYEKIIVIGMGASASNTKALETIFPTQKEIIYIDSLEEEILNKKIKNISSKNSAIVAISKSGKTEETLIITEYILSKEIFKNAACYVISDYQYDNFLLNIAQTYSNKAFFIKYDESVSGRFSILLNASFFPLILAGSNIKTLKLDIDKIKTDAKFLAKEILDLAEKNKNILVISLYDQKTLGFAEWLRQIIAESLGKNKFGITPIISIGSVDEHSQLQLYLEGPDDKIFYILPIIEDNRNKKTSEKLIFSQKRHLKYFEEALSASHKKIIKEEYLNISTILKWMYTIEFIGKLKNINPFNQPAVDKAKELLR